MGAIVASQGFKILSSEAQLDLVGRHANPARRNQDTAVANEVPSES